MASSNQQSEAEQQFVYNAELKMWMPAGMGAAAWLAEQKPAPPPEAASSATHGDVHAPQNNATASGSSAKMELMDAKTYANYSGKAVDDGILRCPRCRSTKTEYFEIQSASPDEPTTKKCLCNDCEYRWKFI
jgi:DNA-directed RNA polymerase subunit M/transcription elongation factor TFIIS